MTRSPEAFCLALKAARERRGVTLAQIAEATKVSMSLFAALERSDVCAWPQGHYRRAFFRAYVDMVGLPVGETMEEFVRLFPDGEAITAFARPAADASALRLSFDPSWRGPRGPIAWRAVTAMIDAGAVLVLAAAFAWLAGAHAGTTIAIVSVSYFTLATLLLGDSATASLLRYVRARALPREAAVDEPVGVFARAWRTAVGVAANVFGSAGEDPSAERVESPSRTWTVRFKLP